MVRLLVKKYPLQVNSTLELATIEAARLKLFPRVTLPLGLILPLPVKLPVNPVVLNERHGLRVEEIVTAPEPLLASKKTGSVEAGNEA